MNDKYLVSAGVDRVLVVWDHETGERVARFGQQPNISAGLHLVHDKLISITIDGVVRAYDIGKGEMVRQFKISDLCKQVDLDSEDRKAVLDVGAGSGGSGMVQWASSSGSTVTVSSLFGRKVQAEILVFDKEPHGHHEMAGDIVGRYLLSEASSKKVHAVNVGDSSDPTIGYDPDTITYDTSAATHAVDEGIYDRESFDHQPCVRPKARYRCQLVSHEVDKDWLAKRIIPHDLLDRNEPRDLRSER
jgi:WD40 repeat protein